MRRIIILGIIAALFPLSLISAGKVYLVLGSDTAIWQSMSTNHYHSTYNQALYTDPTRQAYTVMDPAFRAPMVDSYGTPMKLTWWMMAGQIFRYATNNNFPINNIMTLYLMKKYHGEHVIENGDELTLHYHTFAWTDYDGDGIYYWNQAMSFEESRDDWEFTLAQFLLEEDVFPVSFRSGWHYMDNIWQAELNRLLPYSMHNAWPSHSENYEEPIANAIDWSQSPSEWVPYHPSADNYQLPGDTPGWNLRSAHLSTARARNYMDSVFAHAANGEDQVACFWGHLPETDFADNLIALNDQAQAAAEKYPDVTFKYCTAVEAMQLWRQVSDTTRPVVTLSQYGTVSDLRFTVSTDEPLFQPHPFVAVKYKDESYVVLDLIETAENTWETESIPFVNELAKLGVAATDTAGNLTTRIIRFIPDDIYLDDENTEYVELAGSWADDPDAAWGTTSRKASINSGDRARVSWSPDIPNSGNYHIFYQTPFGGSPGDKLTFVVNPSSATDTVRFTAPWLEKDWIYIGTYALAPGQTEVVELISSTANTTADVYADVIRITPMVRSRDLQVATDVLDLGPIQRGKTTNYGLKINNRGLEALHLQNVSSRNGIADLDINSPISIAAMSEVMLNISLAPSILGTLEDTLDILSDDLLNPHVSVAISAQVEPPFQIVDDEDAGTYVEFGEWFTSTAQAWGPTSRYAWLNSGASASFELSTEEAAIYDVLEIVPTTVNAADNALYIISINDVTVDSVYINQNTASGDWVIIGRYYLPANQKILVEVVDDGMSTQGPVLRADAVKIQVVEPTSIVDESQLPSAASLAPNYPNPFNPVTHIRFNLPYRSQVSIRVYDVAGREVLTLKDDILSGGEHDLIWDGRDSDGQLVETGVYICRMISGEVSQSNKMLLLR